MEIAFSIGFVTTFLVLWFETNVVVDYVNFFNLGGLVDVCEYDDYELDGKCRNYPEYLLVRYPSFSTKLMSCPYCIGFWVTIICCIFLGLPLVSWAMIYILSLLVYLSMCKLSR